ncbi:acVLRF1 family peptidyl-tRNA hydrolase [Actinosynnema sp. NPDC020468]|uniref:acVLRF1 family peptidyl-tRNA hydrolase n=1 Tax=Actinosynnema sp. NPDC020468 TaxID=3154488 RepID=UPI0033DA1F9D
MSRVRPVSGGGRSVEVEPERITGWFERFASRHDGVTGTSVTARRVRVVATDGAEVEADAVYEDFAPTGEHDALELGPLLASASAPRRIGLVLVRLGGHSVGVAQDGRVVRSSTDSHLVHGRNKAGGWSQQRYARRRDGQARVALAAAADDVARVLAPEVEGLDAVVLGGDRHALDALRTDRRLSGVFAKAVDRVLDVGEPRRAVLDEAAARARAVLLVVREPA